MNRPPVLAGSLLVVVGLLLLLDELGQFDAASAIATWWPALVILAGLARLILPPRSAATGTLLVLFGGVLLAWRLELVDDLSLLWPVSLLLVGLWLLLARPGPARPPTPVSWRDGTDARVSSDRLAAVTVFSDRRLQIRPGVFRGGSIVTVFGDLDADLSATSLDRTIVVGGVTVFGDVDLLVPSGWQVTSSGFTLFGDVSIDPPHPSAPGGQVPPELHLDVVTIFGDLAVRRASTTPGPWAAPMPTVATTDG